MTPRPRWLINIVSIRGLKGGEGHLMTDQGDHRVRNGTLIALVNPDLTEADSKRLNDFLNSGAFIASFLPTEGS